MKNYLVLFSFIASTLCAEMLKITVSYAYDIEMNDDKSVIKYLIGLLPVFKY